MNTGVLGGRLAPNLTYALKVGGQTLEMPHFCFDNCVEFKGQEVKCRAAQGETSSRPLIVWNPLGDSPKGRVNEKETLVLRRGQKVGEINLPPSPEKLYHKPVA